MGHLRAGSIATASLRPKFFMAGAGAAPDCRARLSRCHGQWTVLARLCGAVGRRAGRCRWCKAASSARTWRAGRALGVIAPVVVLLIVSSLILWGGEMVSRAIGDIARQAARQDE